MHAPPDPLTGSQKQFVSELMSEAQERRGAKNRRAACPHRGTVRRRLKDQVRNVPGASLPIPDYAADVSFPDRRYRIAAHAVTVA